MWASFIQHLHSAAPLHFRYPIYPVFMFCSFDSVKPKSTFDFTEIESENQTWDNVNQVLERHNRNAGGIVFREIKLWPSEGPAHSASSYGLGSTRIQRGFAHLERKDNWEKMGASLRLVAMLLLMAGMKMTNSSLFDNYCRGHVQSYNGTSL